MGGPLRVFVVEGSQRDVELVMRNPLATQPWDAMLSDYPMPRFSAIEALVVPKESHLDLPCIIVSRASDEDTAVEVTTEGPATIPAAAERGT